MNQHCPSADRLLRLLEREEGDSGSGEIRRHVNHCASCQKELERITSAGWIGTAEGVPAEGQVAAAGETALVELMERMIRETPPDGRGLPEESGIRFPGAPHETAPLGRLRNYRIQERIAAGSQGVLFRAIDDSLNRTVAIKVLRQGTSPSALNQQRFVREARAAAALNDERIVRVHQIGLEPGFPPYLVMEYVAGLSLRQCMERGRPSFGETARWIRDAALGLATAHAAGLVHRDIKPSNLLLDANSGLTRLTDFGLALEQNDAARITQDGHVAGTPAYMSPEQLVSPGGVDARSDIYSLGVVMYELLTGEVPFRGTLRMTLLQVAHDLPRPPRRFSELIPRDLETICLKAMARDRNARFESAGAFAAELGRWQEGQPILSRPAGRMERVWRWARRKPLVASLLASVVGLVLVLGIVMLLANLRLDSAARTARRHAEAAASQRDAALRTLVDLVYELQDRFEEEVVDVDLLQKESLQIALDGLARLGQLAETDSAPALPAAEAFRRMGDILLRLGRPEEARTCLVRAERAFRSLLAGNSERTGVLAGLVETLWSRHDLEMEEDPDGSPLVWLGPAAESARLLFGESPADSSRLMLGKALMYVGRAGFDEAAEGRFPEAVARTLGESRDLLDRLLESGGEQQREAVPVWLEASALLAAGFGESGETARSQSVYEEALLRCSRFADEPGLEDVSLPMELTLRFRLRELLVGSGDRPGADREQQKIESRLNGLQEISASSARAFLRAIDRYGELSNQLDSDGDFEGLYFFSQQRMRLIDARLQVVPDDERALIERALCWRELAESAGLLERPVREVRSAYASSLDLYRKLAQRASFGEEAWYDFLDALLSAAEFAGGAEASDRAGYLEEARAVRDEIIRRFPPVAPEWLQEINSRLGEGGDGNRGGGDDQAVPASCSHDSSSAAVFSQTRSRVRLTRQRPLASGTTIQCG